MSWPPSRCIAARSSNLSRDVAELECRLGRSFIRDLRWAMYCANRSRRHGYRSFSHHTSDPAAHASGFDIYFPDDDQNEGMESNGRIQLNLRCNSLQTANAKYIRKPECNRNVATASTHLLGHSPLLVRPPPPLVLLAVLRTSVRIPACE
jgi:hypothetical protein